MNDLTNRLEATLRSLSDARESLSKLSLHLPMDDYTGAAIVLTHISDAQERVKTILSELPDDQDSLQRAKMAAMRAAAAMRRSEEL